MLRRLQRGPASKTELIDTVLRALGGEVYGGAEGRALDKRFEADKNHLREHFGLILTYHRDTGRYELVDSWEPLLDLPDDALAAVAFLQKTFEPGTPNHDRVQDFLSLLVSYLAPERRGDLDRRRTALAVQWGQRDEDEIDPGVDQGLRRAIIKRRLVEFDYYSPSQADGKPRRHIAQPWERYFDSTRGHDYLRGYCLATTSEAYGRIEQRRYMYYRLGRIRDLQVLPDKLPPAPPSVPMEPVTYRLAPQIARRGEVTRHPGIKILRKATQEDGSIIVYGETESPWWAVRTLLHYGATCEILGGSEVLYEVRRVVKSLRKMYDLHNDKGHT
jgi:predicted DNA-binding transcriptional regulator YafY